MEIKNMSTAEIVANSNKFIKPSVTGVEDPTSKVKEGIQFKELDPRGHNVLERIERSRESKYVDHHTQIGIHPQGVAPAKVEIIPEVIREEKAELPPVVIEEPAIKEPIVDETPDEVVDEPEEEEVIDEGSVEADDEEEDVSEEVEEGVEE